MQWRHGTRFDSAPEAVAQHDIVTLAQFFHESRHIGEVVAVVRIAHDDVRTACACDARTQRRPITAFRHANHARAALFRDLNRTVRRPVIRDNDFAA